jgi:ATP-dependent exoDNAse (exonuclease V) beta subunit
VTRTNAAIVHEIVNCLEARKGFTLLRKISEIFAYPMAITSAGNGKKVYQKKYKFLEEEYENWQETRSRGYTWYAHLVEHVDDQETKAAVNLLMTLKKRNWNLFDVYNKAKEMPADIEYTIATVFTSKGLEFEHVTICDDLNNMIQTIRENGGVQTHDDLVAYRCYYVAASRAGKYLHNAHML